MNNKDVDYTDIRAITPGKKFSIMLSKVANRFVREHKPFDEQCARLEFKDKMEKAEKECERVNGFVKLDAIKINIDEKELEKYGNPELFELVEESPHMQDKAIDGMRTQVLTGYHRDYRCKQRGHGISVFIPVDVYNKEKKKTNKKEE